MNSDLEEAPIQIIDAKKSTEVLQKTIDATDDSELEAQRELQELMGETIEEVEVVEEVVEMYPLGYVHELLRPIQGANGETLTEVCFDQELEGRHVAKMPMDMPSWKVANYLTLIGACTGLHSSELLRLKTCDIMKMIGVATSFFAHGPEIG